MSLLDWPVRITVFSILAVWALVDASLTFHDWFANGAPLLLCVVGLVLSALASLWFIGVLAMTWEWIAHRLSKLEP